MEWYAYAMIAATIFSSLAAISQIGKSRPPITHGAAIIILITNSLYIWGILALAGVL